MPSEVLKFGNCEFSVERVGKGLPLVLFHGEGGSRNARPFVEKLGETFEVHVPTLMGWPQTHCPSPFRTVRDVALVAQEYVERFNQPVTMVGLSFGGWVAAEIATSAPSLVSSLVLISPIGVKIGGREDRDFADLYIVPEPERSALYYAPGRAPGFEPGMNVDIFLEKAIADDTIARLCWQPYMHDPALRPRLHRIRAATLLISGDRDAFVLNSGYYQTYAAAIPESHHEVIAGAGHRVEEEEPKKIAECVISFIASSARPRTTTAAQQKYQ